LEGTSPATRAGAIEKTARKNVRDIVRL
jgi:hypothetical protein